MTLIREFRRRTLLLLSLAAIAGVATISACSSDSNPPDAGSLALALTPTNINVAQGGTGSSAASITRGGAFTGPVTLSASGAPAGVTVTFSPGLIATGATSAGIGVAVDAAVTAGAKTITISAAGTGVTTATATLTVTVTTAAAGSVVLAPSPATLSATAGGAAVTSAIGVTRTAPFAGAVDLTVSGAPANVTASLTPSSVPGGSNSSTLSVTAAAGAVNGTYPLVVRGTGAGIADATATIPVTVTGGAAAGASFTFGTTPLPVTAGGASNTSTVTIARTGTFAPSGALNLALTGAPAGLTASIAPSSNVTAATATVTAQASAAVAAGTYNLTLTGTGTGIPNATAVLPVQVAGGGGGGNATFTWCTEEAPIWVASQDGPGAWGQRTPTSGSTYSFSFATGKGGVAFVQGNAVDGFSLTVIYATLAEFSGAAGGVGADGCGTKTVNGAVASVGATETAAIYLGSANSNASQATPNFVLSDVPDGNLNLMATRTALGQLAANQIILRAPADLANNSTISPGLDFGTQGFPPSTAYTVTASNLGADNGIITSSYLGNGSIDGGIGTIVGYTSASGAVTYSSIPAPQTTAGDLQELLVFAGDAGNSNAARFAGLFFHTPSNKTIAMGPDLATPTVSKAATTPYLQPRAQLALQTEYNKLLIADYSQGDPVDVSASVAATAAYYGAPAAWDLSLPNLSTVTGWSNTWGLVNGTPTDWSLVAQGGSILQIGPPTDGGTIQFAAVSSGSTPLTVRTNQAMQRRLVDLFRPRGSR